MIMEKFILKRDKSLLVIVDIQERLAVAMTEKERVVVNTLHLIESARLLGLPLLITEQYPKGLGPTLPEVRNAVQTYAPIEKITFSCCGEKFFMEAVQETEKKQIILIGMETHVCVLQTCIDLLQADYDVHVVADAVCSRTDANYRTALEYMRDAGAVITCTETVLFQLLVKAGTEEFKAISKRIK
ncbi:MAG: hydrolase [Nitrospirae bacterium]|nr:hydrolase [Nitrospirota bacterium]